MTMSAVEYGINNGEDEPAAEIQTRPGDLDHLRPLPRISVHAFCDSENMFAVMEKLAQDRRMAKVSFRITQGSTQAAANMFSSAPTPNLIILETGALPGVMMDELAPLAEVCDPSTKVVIIGRYNDIPLYRDLIRNGISEYMVAPVSLGDIIAAISSIFVDPEAEPLGRTIAFVGAKGGVGASTIAHNIAWGVSTLFSSETILADLDLAFGTANIDFDQDPAQGIAEAVFAPDRLDDVFLDRLLTKCSEHLSLLAAPSLLDRAYDFDRMAFQPIVEILQRTAPVSVLDVPHSWNEWTRSLLADVDDIVIVAAPDLANLRNAKNLFDQLRKMRPNDKAAHLLLNQVGMPKRPEIPAADFCQTLETEPMAIIPFDIQLFGQAGNSGRMIAEMDVKSPVAEIMSQIAHVITGRATVKKAKKSGLSGILGRLGKK
jgi:pilus assembly protein CpaE